MFIYIFIMKTKLLLPLTFIFFFINFGYSQDEITIDADRPDQSDGVYVLPKNRFQLEDGFVYEKEFLSNELMLRYGLTNSTEIRFIAEIGSDFKKTELNPFEISAKQRLFLQKGVFPSVTLVGYAEIPKSSLMMILFFRYYLLLKMNLLKLSQLHIISAE